MKIQTSSLYGEMNYNVSNIYPEVMKRTTKIRELKRGQYFTLKDIPEPKESQVFVRGEYDRTEKRYECIRFDDISHTRYISGDKEVYTDFTF